jgi:hypothetical protein
MGAIKKEIFEIIYDTNFKKLEYWNKNHTEQLKKDGYYSKKVAKIANEIAKLKLKTN